METEEIKVKVKAEGLEEMTDQLEDLKRATESPIFTIRNCEYVTVNIFKGE